MNTTSGPFGVRRSIWLALAALAVVALLAALAWLKAPAPPPLELTREELVLTGGRLHRPGDSQPFTGILVERYPGGAVQSRSWIVNGQLHGASEGWYTNGQIQVREHFKNGVSHGARTKWHANGNKLSEATIVEGKLHGLFQRWHENGALAERVGMHEGEPHGLAESFYPNSSPQSRVTLEHGQVISQQQWPDGGETQGSSSPPPGTPSGTPGRRDP